MIDLTPYKGHMYITYSYWCPPNEPFIVIKEGISSGIIEIELLLQPTVCATISFDSLKNCREVTSMHELIKTLLVNKNG